jgi:hypothetical protein
MAPALTLYNTTAEQSGGRKRELSGKFSETSYSTYNYNYLEIPRARFVLSKNRALKPPLFFESEASPTSNKSPAQRGNLIKLRAPPKPQQDGELPKMSRFEKRLGFAAKHSPRGLPWGISGLFTA